MGLHSGENTLLWWYLNVLQLILEIPSVPMPCWLWDSLGAFSEGSDLFLFHLFSSGPQWFLYLQNHKNAVDTVLFSPLAVSLSLVSSLYWERPNEWVRPGSLPLFGFLCEPINFSGSALRKVAINSAYKCLSLFKRRFWCGQVCGILRESENLWSVIIHKVWLWASQKTYYPGLFLHLQHGKNNIYMA